MHLGYITYFIPFPLVANKIRALTLRTYSCLPSSSCSELWRVPSAAWVQEQAPELGWFAEHGGGYTLRTLSHQPTLAAASLAPATRLL